MANKYDSLSNAKAFEELRRMQRQQEENSVASKTQDRRYVGTKESVGFIVWTLFVGLIAVIGTEMYNEAMDYCEWKNGYRTEAMASVAKGIAAKVSSSTSAVVTTAIKKMIGYEANAFRTGAEQTDKVKFFLFAMFTIIPAVTGSLGIIPMLFYDLNNDKKEKMYAELLERRKLMSDAVESENEDMLKLATETQINIGK